MVRSLMDVISNDTNLVQDVSLAKTIENIIIDLKLSNDKQINFNLVIRLKHDTAIISAIEPELKSIIQSLIANAIEASPTDSTITISLDKVNQSYQLRIKDQGKGFAEKILNNLFTPHNTDKTYDAGMGLYLAERIIKHKYHGKISVLNF